MQYPVTTRVSCLAILVLAFWAMPCRAASGRQPLWHIGTPGHGDAGFALSPNLWRQYAQIPGYTTGPNGVPTNLGTIKPHYGNHDPFVSALRTTSTLIFPNLDNRHA